MNATTSRSPQRTARARTRAALMVLPTLLLACDRNDTDVRLVDQAADTADVSAVKQSLHARGRKFELVEASIGDIHRAIRARRTTCKEIVSGYIARARAYNGTCTRLVTADGAPVSPGMGAVRAGAPIALPSETVPVSSILPNFERYVGLPLELGRQEPTRSDPTVEQQAGMRVGIPDAGQVNALATLNLRGERSVSCGGACDAHPSAAGLAATCPAACEEFRKQPDALEVAAELDATFGSRPDLESLPLYCIPMSFKDVLDTKDMRSTGNGDIDFALDVPPFDSPVVARLRAKGTIIYAKANAHEYNGGPGGPGGGPAAARFAFPSGVHAISAWAGQACNPYDTEREPRGSSSGSGVSVAANLAMCSICEQTGGSCKGPASRNNTVSLLTTNGIMPGAGGWPNDWIGDRFGIICRDIEDAATVLDAVRNSNEEYFDSGDIYSAIPKALISQDPYASFVSTRRSSLRGIRIGVVREYFVKHAANDVAISDHLNQEIKTVLRDRLGAELVESYDPLYGDDPELPDMAYGFQDAFAEVLPRQMPDYFSKMSGGALEFTVPGYDVTSYQYLLELSEGMAPLAPSLNLRRITSTPNVLVTKFNAERYLIRRGDSRVYDWASLVANTKWREDGSRADAENWLSSNTTVAPGKAEAVRMRESARTAMLKVMYENDIDVFIAPENTLPHRKIGGPGDPTVNRRGGSGATQTLTALLGIPEITVPAGYNRIIYEPRFELNADGTEYDDVAGSEPSLLPRPMPIALMLWAGPGDEPTLIKVASAYEAATQHRVPPADFGPVP